MKKLLAVLVAIFTFSMCAFTLTACGEDDLKTFEYATFKSQTYMYDGLEKSIEVDGVPQGTKVTYNPTNKQTEIGVYEITATIEKEGYESKTLSATLTIVKSDKLYTIEEINALLSELNNALNSAKTETETLIGQIQTEYTAKINALIEELNADKTALETLEKEYKDKVAQIEATASANKTELENKFASDKAELNANIDALEKEYKDKVAGLEATACANKTELENKLASDKKELNADIEALEKEYLEKVAELEATASANKTELENKLASDKAELNADIEALEKAYLEKVAELEATASANKTELENKLASDKAELNAKIQALESQIASVEAEMNGKIADLTSNVTALENRIKELEDKLNSEHKHTFGEWVIYGADDANCEQKLFYRICSDCNVIEWKHGTYNDHDFETVTIAPTCQAQGYDHKTCSACGFEEDVNFVASISHNNVNAKCTVCGEIDMEEMSEQFAFTLINGGTEYAVSSCTSDFPELIIPATYKDLPVTSINQSTASGVFEYNENLISITIPASITSIGYGTFVFCKNLKTVIFEENSNLQIIGKYAFDSCSALESIEIPSSVTRIDWAAFWNTGLKSIVIPQSVTEIVGMLVYKYNDLVIYCEAESKPSGWSNDWNSSEQGKLHTTFWAGEWGYIDGEPVSKDSDKYYTEGLEFTLYNGVSYTVTDYYGSETEVIIPSTYKDLPVTAIGAFAFEFCDSLKSVKIGNNVTAIGDGVFYGCYSLTSVEIPVSLTNLPVGIVDIGYWDYYGINVYYGGGLEDWLEIEFASDYGDENIIANLYFDRISVSEIEIPANVITIKNNAFSNIVLDKVTFEEGSKLESIGAYAFSSTRSIELPNTVKSIGEGAFGAVSTIVIPASVTYLGYNLFGDHQPYGVFCEADSQPASWNRDWNLWSAPTFWAGEWLYSDGEPTPKTELSAEGLYFTYNSAGTEYSVTGYTGTETEVIIPSTYKNIPVTSIGDNAFYDCDSLTSIEIPDSVTSIGDYAFYGCYLLTSIEIPNNVTSIGDSAFFNCYLESITLPISVKSIGSCVFGSDIWNDTLVQIYYEGELNDWLKIDTGRLGNSIIWGDDLWSVVHCKLYLNGTLADSIVIPAEVTAIKNYAFSDIVLSSVKFEENSKLESIGRCAFNETTNIELPKSLKSIGGSAFSSVETIVIPVSVTELGTCLFGQYSPGVYDKDVLVFCEAESQPSGWDSEWTKNDYGTVYVYWAGEWEYVDRVPTIKQSEPEEFYTEGLVFELNSEGTEYSVTDYKGHIDDVVIPAMYKGLPVTSIGAKAFQSHITLTSVVIPQGITSIGDYAFGECNLLVSVIIPASVTSAGEGLFFAGNYGLKIYCEAESCPEGWDDNWSWYDTYEDELKPSVLHYAVYWANQWEYVDGVPTVIS